MQKARVETLILFLFKIILDFYSFLKRNAQSKWFSVTKNKF